MNLKERIQQKAIELGFEGAGFPDIEPFDLYIKEIDSRPKAMYDWVQIERFNVRRGASFIEKHPWARSLVVLIRNYCRYSFPPQLLGIMGRCYQVDERKEKGAEYLKVKFFSFFKR
jgi:epoxyqueuosine reductase QueG